MRKLFSFKLLLIAVLSCTFLFAACDSFLSGSNLQSEVEQVIADLNAPGVKFNISSEGMGDISPSGVTNFRLLSNKIFIIRFIENEKYKFDSWDVVVGEDHNPDYIKIKKSETSENDYIISIEKECELIYVKPVCFERPLIKFTTPEYQSNGVSKDRSIVISFTQSVSLDSFRFSKEELVEMGKAAFDEEGEFVPVKKAEDSEEDIVYKYDENDLIYAYIDNAGTHFKNIEIVSGYDSVADCYKAPYFENGLEGEKQNVLLRIDIDSLNPISLGSSETKDITVTVSRNIFDTTEKSVPMGKDKSWYFKINGATDVKENVTVSSSQGQVYPSGTSKYDMGSSTLLKFEPNDNYQFLYWKSNSECAVILEPENLSTSFVITNQSEAGTEIVPVCAERPLVEKFEPEFKNDGVFKDSTIAITFSKDLSINNNLRNISISCDGMPLNANFKDAVLSGKTITFAADSENLLNVESGSTKTVTVKIPSDLYYELTDGTKVTVGGEGILKTYKISSETTDKTSITFTETTGVQVSITGTKTYNIGEKINLKAAVEPEYEFTGWKILDSKNIAVSNDIIKIEDAEASETSFTVKKKITGVTIAPCIYVKPAITNEDSSAAVPKDSEIVLNFNHSLSEDFNPAKIKVLSSGESVLLNYNAPQINSERNKVTFTPKMTQLIEMEDDQTKTVSVSIAKANLFYEAGSNVIKAAEDQTYTFIINSTTKAKAAVNIIGIPEAVASVAGKITPSGINQYNIGQKVNLTAEIKDGYEFKGWTITGAENNEVKVNSLTDASTFFTVTAAASNVVITPKYYEKFMITEKPQVNANGIEKDKEITVVFNKPLSAQCDISKIKIESNYISVYDNYEIVKNNNKLVFTPKQQNLISFTGTEKVKDIEITVPKSFSYTAEDNSLELEEDAVIVYRINNNTLQKAKVKFINADSQEGEFYLNGSIVFSNTVKELILGEEYELEYKNAKNYKVKYWTVDGVKNSNDITDADNEVVVLTEESAKLTYTDGLTGNTRTSCKENNVTLKVNEPADNIIISTVNYLVPKVASVEPGSLAETICMEEPVRIYFNKDMDPSSFDDIVISIDDSGEIYDAQRRLVYTANTGSKTYYDVRLSKCFEIEVNGNCLILNPKRGNSGYSLESFEKLNLFLAKNELSIGYQSLDMHIYGTGIKDSSGIYLEDEQDDFIKLADVRYKREIETDAPEFRMLKVYANDNLRNECLQTTSLYDLNQNTNNSKTYKLNYTNRKLYIDADVYESQYGSGIRYICCTVDYCYSEENVDVRESRNLSTYSYIWTSYLTEDEDEPGLFHLRDYEYTLPEWGSGYYLVSFYIQDNNNNISPLSDYLICNDTTFDISNLKLSTSNYPSDTEPSSVKMAKQNQAQYLLINYSGKQNTMAAIKGGYMNYTFNWITEDSSNNKILNTMSSGIWTNDPESNSKWAFSEFYFSNWNATKENLVKLEVEDLVHNKASRVYTIPGPAFVSKVSTNGSYTYFYVAPPEHLPESEIAEICSLYNVTRDQIDINPDDLMYTVFAAPLTKNSSGNWEEGSYKYLSAYNTTGAKYISTSSLSQFGANYRVRAKVKYVFKIGNAECSFWGAMGEPYDVLETPLTGGPSYTPTGTVVTNSLVLGKPNSVTCYADVKLTSTFESNVDYFCKIGSKYYKLPFTSSNKVIQCQFETGKDNYWNLIARKNGIEKASTQYCYSTPSGKDRTAPSSDAALKSSARIPIKYSFDGKYALITNLYDSQDNLITKDGLTKVKASYYRVYDGKSSLKETTLYGFEVSPTAGTVGYECVPVSKSGHYQFAIPLKDMVLYTTPFSSSPIYDFNTTLDLYIEDSEGNYLSLPGLFYDRYYALNNKIKLAYDSVSPASLNVSIDAESTNKLKYGATGSINFTNYKVNIQKYDESSKNWINIVDEDAMSTSGNSRYYNYSSNLSNFLRIIVSAELIEGTETYKAFSVPVYCYPSKLNSTNLLTSFIENSGSISIINAGYNYQNFCYAKTVTSSKNWGESLDEWERYGVECNQGYFKDSGTYYYINDEILADIPELDYYCVIMYYANGKSQISSVKQKF